MKSLEQREKREYERGQIIKNAVQAVDRIILDGSDDSVEEINYLTSEVARQLTEKALLPFITAILKSDLE